MVHLEVVFVDADRVFVVRPYFCVESVHLEYQTCFSSLSSRDDLDPLSLFEAFAEVIDMLLNYLPRHLLVLTLNHNRILAHLHNRTEATSQLACHDLRLLSLLESDGGDDVLAFLLVLELLDEVAVLGEGLQLDG